MAARSALHPWLLMVEIERRCLNRLHRARPWIPLSRVLRKSCIRLVPRALSGTVQIATLAKITKDAASISQTFLAKSVASPQPPRAPQQGETGKHSDREDRGSHG